MSEYFYSFEATVVSTAFDLYPPDFGIPCEIVELLEELSDEENQ